MPGTKIGGELAAITNKTKYGEDFYRKIGSIGGSKGRTGGFGSHEIGKDGLTGLQRARIAGMKGGRNSKRRKMVR